MNNSLDEKQPFPIQITYQETLEAFEMESHYHNCYELIYVVEGTAEFKINQHSHSVPSNHMIFINHFETHDIKVNTFPYRRFFVFIDPDYLHSIIKEPVLLSIFINRPISYKHVLEFSQEHEKYIHDLLYNMIQEVNSKGVFWELTVESILKTLLIFLYRNYCEYFPSSISRQNTALIYQIQSHIENHCTEDINLKNTAKMFYTDMYYLSHAFKKTTGYNFKEYIILQRLSKAKHQLYYTSDEITQVCLKSGFSNVNHFIRIFKKYTGLTPLQYRKSLKPH